MKLGLVLEGGASRTLFTCGVLDVLLDEEIVVDYVVGVSAGICSGISYVSKQRGRNYEVDINYMHDKRYMGFQHFLNKNNKSYYNMNFIFDDIPNKFCRFDYNEFAKYKGEVEAVVTNFKTGNAEYLPVPRDDKSFNILRATCALPILFPPIMIDGVQYMDGGIADSIPFEHAFAKGCDKVIVVLTRHRQYVKQQDKSIKFMSKIYKANTRFIDALQNRYIMYNKTLESLREAEKDGKAFVIAPDSAITYKRTERDPKNLNIMYQMGINTTEKLTKNLHKFIIE